VLEHKNSNSLYLALFMTCEKGNYWLASIGILATIIWLADLNVVLVLRVELSVTGSPLVIHTWFACCLYQYTMNRELELLISLQMESLRLCFIS